MTRGAHIFPKSTSHLKILSTRRVTWSKFYSEDPQILGTNVQNLVATTTGNQDLCTTICLECGFFFFPPTGKEIENGSIPWIAFSSVVQNDGPRFHLLQQCRIRRPVPQLQNMSTTLKDWFFSCFLFICFYLFIFIFFSTLRLWGTHLAHNFEYPRSQMMWLTHCRMLDRLYTVCWL